MSLILRLSEIIILCLVFSVIFSQLARRIKANRLGCKPPTTFPLWENIKLFLRFRDQQNRHTVVEGQVFLHADYGTTFRRMSPMGLMIHTIDPANLRSVWKTNFGDWGVENPRVKVLGEFCGRGVITVDGELWEKTHRLTMPHFFGKDAPRVNLAIIEKYFQKYLGNLLDGEVIDLQPLIYAMMFETGYEFLVGESYSKVPGFEDTSIFELLDWLEEGEVGSRRRFLRGPLKYFDRDDKWRCACKLVQKFAEGAIARGRARMTSGELTTKDSTLIEKFIRGFQDPIELRDLVIQVLMGTSTNGPGVLAYICSQLGKNPRMWNTLRDESMAVGNYGTYLGVEAVRRMSYGLRMYRITSTVFRSANRDTILPRGGGADGLAPIFTPKDTLLFVSIWALHRDKAVFGSDAEEFNPDRWSVIKPRRWQYMPFGGGPRACMGREMAITESMYVLCRLAQRYQGFVGCLGSEQQKMDCSVILTKNPGVSMNHG
ncbi:hypothetical protein ACHAO8_011335 [Botrytis cinerea]